MSTLEALVGQDVVGADLLQMLHEEGRSIVRLTGPSGAGKSYAALLAGATWRDAGGRVLVALGDEANGHRALFPFLAGSGSLPRGWRGLATQGSRSALQVADLVVGAGGVSGSVFDLLASAWRQRRERALRHLSAGEREVIADLRRLARSKRLLVIADNAHYWDPASLELLLEVLSERLRREMPQMGSVSVLMVDTEGDQRVTSPEEFRRVTDLCDGSTRTLALLGRDDFPAVLRELGLRVELEPATLDTLFSVTGGHLKVAEQLVAYLSANEGLRADDLGEGARLTHLLQARLRSLGERGEQLSALLSSASVIGLSFDREEIECLVGASAEEVDALLSGAAAIRFIDDSSRRVQFSHEILRDHFLGSQSPSELEAVRTQFERCLAALRPGDYAARAALLLECGLERGRELYALAAVDQLRRRTARDRVVRDAMVEFPDDHALHQYLSQLGDAYQSVATGDYRSPLLELTTAVPEESPLMAAERNYLRAICSMEIETTAGFTEARDLLQAWLPQVRSEFELEIRFMLMILLADVYLERFDEARAIEARIVRRLSNRTARDVRASILLQRLNRRSAGVNTPEVAERRTAAAVDFFRRGTGDDRIDTLELYRALNNHAAMLIKIDRNTEAYADLREAEQIVLDHPDLVTRIDVIADNLVVAGHRSRVFSTAEAIDLLSGVISSPEGAADSFLHRCNLSALLLLDGRDAEAADLLARLTEEVEVNEISETFNLYYWLALRTTERLVAHDIAGARDRHRAMEAFVDALRWPAAGYVRRRQRLLDAVLTTLDPDQDRVSLDRAILDAHPVEVGPAWAYHARLMPLCEHSFWSDS